MVITSATERLRNKNKNGRRKRMGLRFPAISIAYENKAVLEAVAYLVERSINISDLVCKLVVKEAELRRARDSNNNMTYYLEEHQRRLLTLPRIQDYRQYLEDGNPSVTKLFHDRAIREQDLYQIFTNSSIIRDEIEGDKEADLAVKTMLLEALRKHG